MAREEIEAKLKSACKEKIEKECQVIYILSRIRKYIEDTKSKNEFAIMNSFCNWALHNKIDDTRAFEREFLYQIIGEAKGNGNIDIILNKFTQVITEFKKEVDLPKEILEEDNFKVFKGLLLDIYSSTPLKITINNNCIQVEIIKNSESSYILRIKE